MKIYANKKYQTIAVYAAIVIAVNVLLVLALNNISDILDSIYHLFDVLQPVTWGLIIAFLTNPVMVRTSRLMEKLYKKCLLDYSLASKKRLFFIDTPG